MSAEVDAVVREVARHIDAKLDTLTPEMTDHFVQVIPEFRHDETVRQLMIASTASNLSSIVDMLAHSIPLDQVAVPAAASEYARRFAQQDLSLEALLRAYRLGEQRFLQWALETLDELDLTASDAIAAASQLGRMTNHYIDHVIEGLIDIYNTERSQWHRRSDAARAARIRAVLSNDALDVRAAEETLDVPLRGWHLGAIAWSDTPAAQPSDVLDAARQALGTATGQQPLSMLDDEYTLWCWVSSAATPRLNRKALARRLDAHPSLRMALGLPVSGLNGFRVTHRQAQQARAVAEASTDDHRITEFSQVAVAGFLVDKPAELRAWSEQVLGRLLDDNDQTAQLRQTVRAFLATGSSYTNAAERLHLHKNTVLYRVRKAESILGHPLDQHRLETEVALLACEQLGRAMFERGDAARRSDQ